MNPNPFARQMMTPLFPLRLKRTPRPRTEDLRRDPFEHLSARELWDMPTWHPAREEVKR